MQELRWPTYPIKDVLLESGTEPGGMYLRDTQGKEYLDAVAGIGCAVLGHGHPKWVAAIQAQLGKIASMANSFRSEPSLQLAERLIGISPVQDGRVFFANTGAEATEAALKLCLKATGRPMVISFSRGFHGRTLGALSLTANPKYRDPFVSNLGDEPKGRYANCQALNLPFDDLPALEAAFSEHGSKIAAVFIEPVQGEGGVFPASKDFLLKIRELCSQHGALFGLDEIQSGIGRSGFWTSWEAMMGSDCPVDVVWYAKALGAGYPIGACVARADLAASMGLGSHGTTFGGNPAACAAALATLDIIAEEGLLASAKAQIDTLRRIAQASPIPEVTEIRGIGAMIGIQIKKPEDAAAKELGQKMMQRGVLVTTPGGHTIRSLLPYRAGEAELSKLWETLRAAIAG